MQYFHLAARLYVSHSDRNPPSKHLGKKELWLILDPCFTEVVNPRYDMENKYMVSSLKLFG